LFGDFFFDLCDVISGTLIGSANAEGKAFAELEENIKKAQKEPEKQKKEPQHQEELNKDGKTQEQQDKEERNKGGTENRSGKAASNSKAEPSTNFEKAKVDER